MTQLQTPILSDTWLATPWDAYVQLIEDPAYAKAKGYYYQGHMRIEMLPVGFDHAKDHSVLAFAINLFAILKAIPLTIADNCSYRKAGLRECQPDLSCYVGKRSNSVPSGTNIVNLDRYPAPDLVSEISKTTLLDDLGTKRSLYEALGVSEYWVADVENVQIMAYSMNLDGSQRIAQSQVLPDLKIATLDEALRRSRQTDQSAVGSWLMAQFQS
jgi:Uma2 family endonuclease